MIDIIARGMIEGSNGDISQLFETVTTHTENDDIHVTTTDKENWNSHPNDVQTSGNPVTLGGLQGGVPFSEMVVKGKNLCKYPYHSGNSTHNKITFTMNDDGSVTANGTATGGGIAMYGIWGNINPKTLPPGTYTISGCPKQDDKIKYQVILGTINTRIATDVGNGASFTLTEPTDVVMRIYIFQNQTAENVVFFPQLEIGDTATAYEQPITGRDITLTVNGTETTITPDTNPYVVPNDIRQRDGINNISVSAGEISVTGVRKNAAVKKIWDKLDELTTAIIVSNAEI